MRRSLDFFRKIFIMGVLLSVFLSLFLWTSFEMLRFNSEGLRNIVLKMKLCHTNFNDERFYLNNRTDLKMIYHVTPTYPRPEQIPELTRLAHTLMHVPRLHWIVADDQPVCSDLVLDLLKRTGLPFTHISSPKPSPPVRGDLSRGVINRRAALSWISEHVQEGILYFGDDDNTYDLRLFDEIRKTKKVSMFPVGLMAGFGVSSPVVKDGKVVGFFDSWPGSRKFAVDMAGFAINIEFLTPYTKMPFRAGYLEDSFLASLGFKMEEIEPLADNCSRILVWHSKSVKLKKPTLKFNVDLINPKYSSFVNLLKETSKMHMASLDPNVGTELFITRNRRTFHNLNEINLQQY